MEPRSSSDDTSAELPSAAVVPPDVRIETDAPVSVATLAWRPRAGEVSTTLMVKATFRLEPYLSPVSDEPDPIEAHDRVPFKRSAEIVAVGHAHAPEGHATHSVVARMVYGNVDKTVELWAERVFGLDGDAVVAGPAQTKFSLDYARAAGGPGTDNPIGVSSQGEAIASMQPRAFVPRRGLPLPTIGLGPLDPTCPVRARRLRDVDAAWLASPTDRDAPAGFDPRFFAFAPPDQRLADPVDAETRLELESLHPESDRLVTYLAKVDPVLLCEEGDVVVPELVADTLVIDADRGVATVTWRGVLTMPASRAATVVRLRVDVAPDLLAGRATTIVPVPVEVEPRLVDLLGFETEIPSRIRRVPALSSHLDGAMPGDGPPKLDVLRVLASSEPTSLPELRAELARSRALELPLFPLCGELVVGFDELEALRIAVVVAARMSSTDRNLRGALELAERVVDSPAPLSAGAAAALLSQLYACAAQLPFPAGFLEDQVGRALRERRLLKRRHVLGAPHVRAEITLGDVTRAVFISESIAAHLPMSTTFPVVALVEARPGEDMGEPDAEAFVALALGRVIRAASVRPAAA